MALMICSLLRSFEMLLCACSRHRSLDRFGDFASDRVSAPVRDAAARALATLLSNAQFASAAACERALQCLLEMARRGEWEVRFAAATALKYTLAARKGLLCCSACR